MAALSRECWCILLLLLEVSIVFAQHILVSPQSYHIGAEETISFTSYIGNDVNVSAELSYSPCQCRQNRARRNYKYCSGSVEDYESYSTDTATVSQGQNAILKIKMPDYPKSHFGNNRLSITDSLDTVYMKKIIYFEDYGYILLKTDKPIYKPSQTVKFCAIHVDNDMKPVKSSTFAVQVTIRDNKYRQILKLDITTDEDAFFCQQFPLSDEPSFGQWSITAQLKVTVPDSKECFNVPTPTGSCDFEVKEFVLPKFDITISAPKYITSKDRIVRVAVLGNYVFGERLRGTVKLNATLKSPGRKDILIHEETEELVYGAHTSNILIESILSITRYLYNPFCVKGTKIKVVAEVTEDGRDLKASDIVTIPLKSDTVSFTFADSVPKFFRPGLSYTVKAIVKSSKGLSDMGVKTRIVATINNGRQTIHDIVKEASKENDEYIIESSFVVPTHANCLKINLYPVNVHYSCETESVVCMTPAPFYSPTRSFMQLTSQKSVYKVGSEAAINVTSTTPLTLLHYIVISGDNILLHNKLDVATSSDEGVTQTGFTVPITHNMVPKTKILAGFARTDGELVMDLLEIEIECELEHKVSLSLNVSNAEPGDGVAIATDADPDSVILLSVFDSSLRLLRASCKSASQDNVCKLLGSRNYGNLDYVDTSCSTSSESSLCCPSSCSEPTKYSVETLFQATGITIDSDMFIPKPPPPPSTPSDKWRNTNRFYDLQFDTVRISPINTPPTHYQKTESDTSEAEEDGGKTREYFPESWIWTILKANATTGRIVMTDIIPDTITTWTAEAIAVSPQKGLGISLEQSLTVKKQLFVSLELPYSVNWGETVTLTPVVFNLLRHANATKVEISVSVHEELSIVDLKYPKVLAVESSSSESFNLIIRPRSVGRFYITITIYDKIGGLTDKVKKDLFVKPGCSKRVDTTTTIASDSGEQCYSYSLPDCVVPGTATAEISITGDIMSFPNLDHLLVLPSGCGEQNLIRTAINYVVAEYLSIINALQDHVAVKIKNNLQIGYQKQLNYLSSKGCFSIWPNGKCSSWLTAAVVRYFSGIHSFYADYDEDLIDDSVIQSAVKYLLNKQKGTGKFDLIGRSHNDRLLNDKGRNTNTAFTLVALKRYKTAYELDVDTSLNDAISKAEDNLISKFGRNKFCVYGLAISVYGLHMTPANTSKNMKDSLKTKIKKSEEYPGTCFACDMSRKDCGTFFVTSERSSVCVETTAYTLLALLSAGDTEYTVCLSRWLVRIRNGAGGYYSSQDTIVALEALAKFAEATFTKNIDLHFAVSLSSNPLTTSSHDITETNRYVVHKTEVTSVPSERNCVKWSGSGTGIVQSTLVYYGCNCDQASSHFSLVLSTSVGRVNTLSMSIRLQYLAAQNSNMVILDVEFPSGYSLVTWSDLGSEIDRTQSYIERRELKGSSIVLYLSELSQKSNIHLALEMKQDVIVSNPQLSPVTVYDYYDPGDTVTKYYRPETEKVIYDNFDESF